MKTIFIKPPRGCCGRASLILRASIFLVGAALVAACSSTSNDATGAGGAGESSACFLAFEPQFEGFRSWTSNHYDAPSDIGLGTHVTGPRTEYVNELPPAGAVAFPVGTIIVKEIENDDPAMHHIFAMVKRGCGFNSAGANGWEWFELAESDRGTLAILWRGVGPPSGETYGAGATGGCNTCHASACATNDAVCSPSASLHLTK